MLSRFAFLHNRLLRCNTFYCEEFIIIIFISLIRIIYEFNNVYLILGNHKQGKLLYLNWQQNGAGSQLKPIVDIMFQYHFEKKNPITV